METEVHTCLHINAAHYDPTRTITLRNAFVREMNKRFDELARVIRIAIVEEDVFGLLQAFQMTTPGAGAFAFPRSQQKIDAFMRWLELQIDRGILYTGTYQQLGVGIETAWTDIYITDSYKRGVQRARYEMNKPPFNIPSLTSTGGIEAAMSGPFHLDRLGVLYSRVFNELKGITAAMDQQISRVLTQGIADGDNPVLLARKLVAVINGKGADKLGLKDTLGRWIPGKRRAQIMARTEIIRAHHQATIQEYKNWAIEGVIVKAEWMTAGDNRVCNQCADLQGEVFTLEEVQNMIPLHPQCRCVALPYKEYFRTGGI